MPKIQEDPHDVIIVVAETEQEATERLREELQTRKLIVTPSPLFATPGSRTALRVRSNCAWRLQFGVEGLVPSITEGFGNATIDIEVNEDFTMPGDIIFLTDDDTVAAQVHVCEPPEPEEQAD